MDAEEWMKRLILAILTICCLLDLSAATSEGSILFLNNFSDQKQEKNCKILWTTDDGKGNNTIWHSDPINKINGVTKIQEEEEKWMGQGLQIKGVLQCK